MSQNMGQANIDQLAAWKAEGNQGDLPVGWKSSNSGGGGGSTDLAATQAQILEMYKKANEPAIASLTASIPETQSKFAFERTKLEEQRKPLEQRYQNLLDEVTRQEGVATGAATTQTSQELGARGILGSSALFGKTINAAVAPIQAQYTGMAKDVGLERENKLMELTNLISQTTPQEVESVRAIQNAIATLQSGAGANAINAAITMVNQAKANEAALAAKRMDLENSTPSLTSVPKGNVLVDSNGNVVYANTASTGSSGGGNYYGDTSTGSDWTDITNVQALRKQMGGYA